MKGKYRKQSNWKPWRKKRTPAEQKIREIQQQKEKNRNSTPSAFVKQSASKKKALSFKRKPVQFNKKKNPWTLPLLAGMTSLLLMILIVPSLIAGSDRAASEEGEPEALEAMAEPEATHASAAESPFSVAVMRTTTETVEDVPLEEYVARVVAAEMPADFELEALKAQSLAARTYTVNHLLYGEGQQEGYDVTDTVQHQVYKNDEELIKQWGSDYEWKMERIQEAVAATEGQILTYESQPITAAFFSTSNGKTENSEDYWENEIPYLRSVDSPWDKESPKYTDQETYSLPQLAELLEIDLPAETPLFIEESRTESGRVDQVAFEGNSFSGREVRERLNLPSSDFSIKQSNNHIIFTTEGYGHGVGMSQYGANGMAKEGKTYEDIIHHYYQDVEISTVTETAPALVSN